MIGLLSLLAATGAPPSIAVKAEGDHYRLTVDVFRVSQGEAVAAAIASRMQATCAGKPTETLDMDFRTADPANGSDDGPAIERAVWDYWLTFRCAEPPRHY